MEMQHQSDVCVHMNTNNDKLGHMFRYPSLQQIFSLLPPENAIAVCLPPVNAGR